MSRAPITLLLVVGQILMASVLTVLCVVWMFRTRELNILAYQTNLRQQETSQNRQAFVTLLQDTAAYSERNPAMRSLLQQLGVKFNNASPTNVPANRR